MSKQRHNIDTIAEVLIDKLNDLDRTASRIEKATEQDLQVDTRELKSLLSDFKAVSRDFSKKEQPKVPKWVYMIAVCCFFGYIGFMFFYIKELTHEREGRLYFEMKLSECEKASKL